MTTAPISDSHEYVVFTRRTRDAELTWFDLRDLDRDQLLELQSRVLAYVDNDVEHPIVQAIDYLADGGFTRDQLDKAKADELRHVTALLDHGGRDAGGEIQASLEESQRRLQLSPEAAAVLPNPPTHDELIARVNALTAELADARVANRGMDEERSQAYQREQQAQTELAEFKQQVVDVADTYAERHDWCEVVDRALGELGLERPENAVEYRATVTITFDLIAKRTGTRALPGRDWVRGSMNNMSDIENAIDDLEMDSDHDEDVTEVRNFRYDVTSVEETAE